MIILKETKEEKLDEVSRFYIDIFDINHLPHYIYNEILNIKKDSTKKELCIEDNLRRYLLCEIKKVGVVPSYSGLLAINENNIGRSIKTIVGNNSKILYYYKVRGYMVVFMSFVTFNNERIDHYFN